jgi:5'(3')-deoxyribonucleotidase
MSADTHEPFTVSGLPLGWTTTLVEHPHGRQLEAQHPVHGRTFVGLGRGPVLHADVDALRRRVRECLPEITVVYLDVDEVLADWVGAALRLLGHDPETVYALWSTLDPRPWDVFQVVPRPPKTNDKWDAIDAAGSSFWANLEPFEWMADLLALCREFAPTVLLTSPSQHSSSHAGKYEWIQRHFGRTFKDYLLGSCKHRCAHPGALLIDDSPKNCAAFREHGGHAILFPGVGNDLHTIPPTERVTYVASQLAEYRS